MVLGFFGFFFVYLQAENTYNIKKKDTQLPLRFTLDQEKIKGTTLDFSKKKKRYLFVTLVHKAIRNSKQLHYCTETDEIVES